MKKTFTILKITLLLIVLSLSQTIMSQTFVHPGGLHTIADLDRMKTKVAEGAHPWIDGWNALLKNNKAQSSWGAEPHTSIGGNNGIRQRAELDAHAAYFNTLRWYISGDTAYAECAVRIINAWANTLTSADGELFQLATNNFMQAAELLRAYPEWKDEDIAKVKTIAHDIFYPACRDFLPSCSPPASWHSPALSTMLIIGVFCDDVDIYNEAIEYFKNGSGNGSLLHAIPFESGQIEEMGRDMVHANIGPGCLAEMCQTAFNQGDTSLYSYGNNRIMAAFEYYCKYNLNHLVTWIPVNNCAQENFLGVSYYNARGYLTNNPVFEMVYNYYGVRKGLNTPWVKAMANLARPEGENADFFGYGTLTHTLDSVASPYPAYPIPAAPTDLVAKSAVGKIYLEWTGPADDVANGYNIFRSTSADGEFTSIYSTTRNTLTTYTDWAVVSDITYFYKVSANNQSGTSDFSAVASSQAVEATTTLPTGWTAKDIGRAPSVGTTTYADVVDNTFIVRGSGRSITDISDTLTYAFGAVTGDFTFTTHMVGVSMAWTGDRVGIMIRESLDPDSKSLTICQGGDWNDYGQRFTNFITRSTTGGKTTQQGGNKFTFMPWYRFNRTGNVFTAYQSTDGISYGVIGTSTVEMNSNCYLGFAVCSGSTSSFAQITYENVSISGGTGTLLSAPIGLTGSAGNLQASLSWDALSDAPCYNLKRAKVSGGPYTAIATGISTTSYTDHGLYNDTTYYYVVVAANFAGEGENSSEVSVTPKLAMAPVPVDLIANSASATQINLSWTSSLSAATYNIKRSTISGGPYTTIASPDTTSYYDTAVTTGTTYYYVISAVNAIGETDNSLEVSAIPGQVCYLNFDETSGTIADDLWGSNNGTLLSGATFETGAINNSVKLDGTSNGYVTLPTGIVSTLTDFSISTWVKEDVYAIWGRVFDFGTSTGNYMFLSTRNTSSNGKVRFAITTGGGEQGINSSSVITTGTWNHLAVTQSGSVAILYINGVEVGRNEAMTLNPSNLGITTQNWIGKSQWADPMLNGNIDDFRIYSRALDLAEIEALHNAGDIFTAVVTHSGVEDCEIYPNPFTNYLTCNLGAEFNNGAKIQIVNINGQIVYSKEVIGNTYTINIEHIPIGIYVLKITNKNKVVFKKIVKK